MQKPKAEDIDENAPEVHAPKTTASGVKTAPVAIERGPSPAGLARTVRAMLRVNQRDGFDCPGCVAGLDHGAAEAGGILRERCEGDR
ncbi:MAG: hypothetical protein ACXVBO_15055 [Isosphaeraceae bacterium]